MCACVRECMHIGVYVSSYLHIPMYLCMKTGMLKPCTVDVQTGSEKQICKSRHVICNLEIWVQQHASQLRANANKYRREYI